jgi:hypothetical protein
MIKRWLPSAVLLLVLGALIVAYVAVISNLQRGIYTPDQRNALIVHRRLNLIQAAPVSNFYRGYLGDELVVLEVNEVDAPGIGATMGATDCRVRATLDARYEEVEGVNTTVYDLDFEGTYTLRYIGSVPTTTLELIFPFPTGLDTLNQVYFLVDGKEPAGVQYNLTSITWWTEMASGEEREIVVRYRARGVGSFRYALDHGRRLESLDVEIAVQGLTGSEIPASSLATTTVENAEDGEQFAWQYDALIADRDVEVTLPTRPSFIQRVEQLQDSLRRLSLASPFLVVLFAACLASLHRLSDVRLPFQHYLLSSLGFFLFYPALTFLSGLLELPLAAAVAFAAVAVLLTVFLGRAAGWRHTWWQTLLLTAVFLGLFSLGGMSRLRGLLITTGGLLLVGAFMLLTARRRPAEPQPPISNPEEEPHEVEIAQQPPPEPTEPPSPSRYCPHCGGPLDEAFAFCPTCGHNADRFRRCDVCGSEHYVPPEATLNHCPSCGSRLTNQQANTL